MSKKIDGKEVANSVRTVRVTVTESDIKGGDPLDPENCAAARAIKRTLNVEGVKVHRGVTYIQRKGKWERFKTSGALRLETIIFDRGGRFLQGEYDLLAPSVSMIVGDSLRSKSPSKGKSQAKARLATRRMTIPGVRKSAGGRDE